MAQSQHKRLFIVIAGILGGFCLLVFTVLVALTRGTIYTRNTFHHVCVDCAMVTERVHQRLFLQDAQWTNLLKTPLHQTLFPEDLNHNHRHRHERDGLSQFVLEITDARTLSYEMELANLVKDSTVAAAFEKIKKEQSIEQSRDLWWVFVRYVMSERGVSRERPWESRDINVILTFLKDDPHFGAFRNLVKRTKENDVLQ
jgi:hypothetical protein